jgi:hypothetical protein
MKEKITYVDAAHFEALIRKHVLGMEAQAGFIKVQGPTGYCIYVARTKRVGRVDLSWGKERTMEGPGFRRLGGEAFGNVHQQLDFSLPEAEILANFEKALVAMKGFPPVERKARAAKAGGPKAPAATGWSKDIPVQTKADRKRLIEEEAKKRGLSVSPKTVAEIKELEARKPGTTPAAKPAPQVRAAADKA